MTARVGQRVILSGYLALNIRSHGKKRRPHDHQANHRLRTKSPSEHVWDTFAASGRAEMSVVAAEQQRLQRCDPILIAADHVRSFLLKHR